jgi:hypothetical protein
MATKPKRPRDVNQLAKLIVDLSTGDAEDAPKLTGKKADSQSGGLRGGKSRMEMLTPEQRSELAKQAAAVRWQKAAPAVKAGAAKPTKSAK